MKKFVAATFAAFALILTASSFIGAYAAEGDLIDVRDSQDDRVPIIFDTDIGGDIDDAFALALIHRCADRGLCDLIGVTLTNPNTVAARFVAAENACYGRPDIPVGVNPLATTDDSYSERTTAQRLEDGSFEYPVPDGFKTEEPVALLRRLLADAKDRSVVFVQVGASTNLAALLDSPADDVSPLTGRELVAQKARFLSIMGGAFAFDEATESYRNQPEWNIKLDTAAAQKVAREWPTEIAFSGYEVGDRIRTSPVNLKRDYRSKKAKMIRDAFQHWAEKNAPSEGLDHQRPTWDLTAFFFVVRPEEGRGYYTLSEPLDVDFDDEARTVFAPNPNGTRRAYIVDEKAAVRVGEAFVNLCSEP